MEIFTQTKIDFLGKTKYFVGVSLCLLAAGAVSLVMKGGPRFGVDFKGGTLVYIKFQEAPRVGEIRQALEAAADDYGINISRAEITDVELKPETQRAMAEVLEAERLRRAAILRAEGEKRAVELAADAALYKQQREAEALLVTAQATADSNRRIREARLEGGDAAARFQIAERQIDAFQKLAASSNSKIIVLPGDATDGFTRAATILAKD